MSAEIDIPLTFATFYTCGIKQSTNLTQRDCINLLLKGYLGSDSIDILSDSVCSNYVKGKKNLTNDLRVKLLYLTKEEAINRLNKINIQDFTLVANALSNLIVNSSLPDNEKKRLVNCYESKAELTFVAEVFLSCLKGDNFHPLTKASVNALEGYRYNIVSANRKSNDSTIFERTNWRSTSVSDIQADAITNDIENDEDFDWMRNYVPNSIINTPPTFARSKVETVTVVLELPSDYSAMIYSLKPTFTESAYDKFTIEDFTKTMNIDITHNTFSLQKGSLEYWQFEGTMESVLPSLKYYNFSEVSDFALQLIGEFTAKDVDDLKQYLKDVSNDNVNILTSLIIDKELANVKLILIVHKCLEKVEEQKSDTDHDGTHRYIPRRSVDINRKL